MYEPLPYYDQCSLLLPMFGDNNGTVFSDYSPNPKTVTVAGNAKTSTAQSKYYGSSGYFDGNADYLALPDSNQFDLGASDFTISFWMYFDATSVVGYPNIINKRATETTGLSYWIFIAPTSNNCIMQISTNGTSTAFNFSGPTPITLQQWVHVAVVRSGDDFRMYINGVGGTVVNNGGVTIFNSSADLLIATDHSRLTNALTGYLQDFFIINDAALWTANFTPPTRLIETWPEAGGYLVAGGITPYSITLSLTESLAATEFTAVVTNANTGFIMSKTTVSGSTPTINLSTNDPCMVTLYPDYGTMWTASTTYALNDKVFPTDPATTPYYYECTTAGTSDASEPTWPTSGTVNDGTAVWTYVERMVQPITQGPLIPA